MNAESSQTPPDIFHGALETHPIFDDISVLKRIIDYLVIGSTIPQHHLFSVALICKTLSDLALDVLWESLDSLMPLLKLLPPFKLVNGFYVLQGPFNEKDWRRFDTYSYRVKKLTVIQDCPNVAPSTYVRLAQLRPLLLPALEELNSPSTSERDTNLLLFLSPTLKRLNIGGDQIIFHKLISPALAIIAYESEQGNASLTHLTLCGQPPPHEPGLLGQFSNLRHLDILGVIDAHNFRELGELNNLESMVIQLPRSLTLRDVELGFRKLRSLHIASSFPSLLFVLEKIATTNLESLVITATPTTSEAVPDPALAPTPLKKRSNNLRGYSPVRSPRFKALPVIKALNNWRELVKIVNSRWSLTLQLITIIQDKIPDTIINPTPSNLFSDLSPFQRLERLEIQQCKFFPCDEGIHLLALACPNLKMLHLPVECVPAFAPPKADPDAIDFKPTLSETSTTIVALWSLPPFLNTTIRSHHLSRLSVSSHQSTEAGRSHLMDIARHIDRLFPYLETIKSHSYYGAEVWNEVRRILSVYKMVRLDDSIRRSPPST